MSTCSSGYCVITLLQSHDKVMTATRLCCIYNLFIRGIRSSHTDILHNCFVKKVIVLGYICYIFVVIIKGNISYIYTTIGYPSRIRIPERCNQFCNC